MSNPDISPAPMTDTKDTGSNKLPLVIIIGVIMVVIFGILTYFGYELISGGLAKVTPTPVNPNANGNSLNLDYYKFADYTLQTVNMTPSVKSYVPKADLSNVYYLRTDAPDGYYTAELPKELTTKVKQALASDYMAITPGTSKEFYPVYEANRYSLIPNFVTVDSIMHTYHLMFDSILKNLEQDSLASASQKLTADMTTASLLQYQQYSADPELEPAAKRNLAFFAVAAKLFNSNYTIPDTVKPEVDAELALINAHTETFAVSPVLAIGFSDTNSLDNVKEDYTQYIVRGHYTATEQLQNYFMAMMWLGRMTFLSKDKTTVQSALLMTNTMKTNAALFSEWEGVYAPINFFVGKADDLTFYEYLAVYNSIYGNGAFAPSGTQFDQFWAAIKKLPTPQINSIPIYDANIQPDIAAATAGFRFMGQRFTVDAMIFQNLIYRDVTEKTNGDRLMFPTSLEVPAAMGNQTAVSLIKSNTDFYTYPNYEAQMTKMQQAVIGIDQAKWTQNLYWSWLYTLNGMTGKAPQGYPDFMRTDKWAAKELNTYVASWTELKHDTILYSKQVMAEAGDSGPVDVDDRGYVEPNTSVWQRLLALVQMTRSGLESRSLITSTAESDCNSSTITVKQREYCNLSQLETTVQQLLTISGKELQEQALTDEEYSYIKFIGSDLESMFLNTLDPGADLYAALNDNPAMLIADVASAPGQALEEATGYVNNIYVLVPVDGQLRVAKGPVYSQYEFKVAAADRMTDADWRTMLAAGKQPAMLKWQQDLITNP